MSLVAKVFVVLNLLVSVAFLIFAANVWTAQTKWQKMYEQEKIHTVEKLAKIQQEEVKLYQDVVHWATVVDAKRKEITTLTLDRNKQRDDLLAVQVELATLKNARDMKDAENQELQREVRRYADELTKIKGVVIKQQQAVVVERENATRARNERAEMENDYNVVKQTYNTLARDHRAMEQDLALQTRRIEKLLELGVDVAKLLGETQVTQTPVDAQVLAVRPEVGLVMISAGSQQNVKPGYQLTISRGDQFIARVQVDRVYPDMCSAKVIPGMGKKEIEVHDEAKCK
ncbi:MAG TPA: hypothetical protein VGP72_04820 [Planctomycetota bacterium]